MLEFDQIVALVRSKCNGEIKEDLNSTPKGVIIPSEDVVPVCKELLENSSTYFDMLSCLTGIDNGIEANTMEVVYNLYSIPFNHHLTLASIDGLFQGMEACDLGFAYRQYFGNPCGDGIMIRCFRRGNLNAYFLLHVLPD